jgi:hypothetical protein
MEIKFKESDQGVEMQPDERKHLQGISRREFLQAGVGLAAAASGINLTPGHALAQIQKDPLTSGKEKPTFKIHPPANGCLVGFYKEQHKNFQMGNLIASSIKHYCNALGANPATFAYWTFLSQGFPTEEARAIKENGIIPYINIMTGHNRWKMSFDPDDIVQGRCNNTIKALADGAAWFGEKYGNFFFTTMVESNAVWWYWSSQPNTAAAIRHMWQIFEDSGANKYATWVWEAFCPARYGNFVADPELYYPGDKYADWIGLNVFANLKNPHVSENTKFGDLVTKTYEQMRKSHPQKPIMVSEFGRTPGDNQPAWLVDAFHSMKDKFPAVKAAIYYDNVTQVYTGQDHTLDEKSLGTLKEIFQDPYWIMAK